jgi:hypothetical protein
VNVTRYADESAPPLRLAWFGPDGALRDLTGEVISVEVKDPATGAVLATWATGLVAGDGTGSSNLALTFPGGQLSAFAGRTVDLRPVTQSGLVFTVDADGDLLQLRVLPVT